MLDPTQYTATELAKNLAKTVVLLMLAGRDRDKAIEDVAISWALSPAQIQLIRDALNE